MASLNDSNTSNNYDEAQIAEVINYNSAQTTLNVTTTAQEVKVGASRLADRKAIFLLPLDANIKWGFTSGSQPFLLFKRQFIILPIGDNVAVWTSTITGTGSLVVGEAV